MKLTLRYKEVFHTFQLHLEQDVYSQGRRSWPGWVFDWDAVEAVFKDAGDDAIAEVIQYAMYEGYTRSGRNEIVNLTAELAEDMVVVGVVEWRVEPESVEQAEWLNDHCPLDELAQVQPEVRS